MNNILPIQSKQRLIKYCLILFCFLSSFLFLKAQESAKLDVSMFWKKSEEQLSFVEDAKGDLFSKLAHHGPAVENLWLAYRVYFNSSSSVDILSKFQPRLELRTSHWYPKKNACPADYGTDNYNVGSSVGLGGIKLFDPEVGLQKLNPVSKRTAQVLLEIDSAQIIMTSYGIPYLDYKVDIEFKLTCYADSRHAKIEVKELNGKEVQFATGIALHSKLESKQEENYLLTWGDYNSHAKYAVFNIGAAILYNPKDFESELSLENEQLFISKPCSSLSYFISACNDKELAELNSLASFENYLKNLSEKLIVK